MQVNILSTDKLNRAGAKTLQDYLGNEAGVDVKSLGGAGVGSLSIRGVSTGFSPSSTVGVYIDEVSFGSSTVAGNGAQMALDMALLDLHHIELLRGPQGTLYGASAMGGLLKYVTNEPDTYEFSGKASLAGSVTRGGGSSHTLSAVVNAPLKEDVAGLRVSAFSDHAGGSTDAVGIISRNNNDRGTTRGARASLLLTPMSKLKLRLTGTTQTIRRDGIDYVDYSPATAQPIEGPRARRLFAAEPYDVKTDLLSADVEYDFGWARLNSITARQRVRSDTVVDLTSGYIPLLVGTGLDLASTPGLFTVGLDKRSQELRLTSKSDKRLEWLAGFYYNHEESTNTQRVATFLHDGTPGPDLATFELPAEYREVAFYGDLTWKTANGLSVTGGLRLARNKQHFVQVSDGMLAGGSQSIDSRSNDSSKTWLLTGRYALSPGSDVYLRAATGYRPGGPNAVLYDRQTGEPLGPPSFGPDTLRSLEAGYKADLLDKTLSLEAAVFDIRWKDLQQLYSVNGVAVIVNAGAAQVRGAELSASYRPNQRWTFSGNAALLDAKLTEDAAGLGGKAGARLPGSAKFSASFNVNYAFDLAGHASYVGLSQRYVGQRNSGFADSSSSPLFSLPAYGLTDLQAGIDFKRVSVALFVRNLFDKRALLAHEGTVQAIGGPAWVSPSKPRTLGATVTLPF